MTRANDVSESTFQRKAMESIGGDPRYRLWRQLNGQMYRRVGPPPERECWCRTKYVPVTLGPPNGAADSTGAIVGDGRRLEVEFKSESGRLSEDQENWRSQVKAWGCVHLVAKYDESMSMKDNVARVMRELEEATR